MISQLRADRHIPPHVFELAASHNVGIPLKRQRSSLVQIIGIVGIIALAAFVGSLCYNLYEYIAFIRISQIYPNIYSVPSDQFNNYMQLYFFHNDFWQNLLQISIPLLGLASRSLVVYIPLRTKLYICTDGLIKIYKKKDEAIRWDEVKEYYLTGSKVSKLVKADGSSLTFPLLLMNKRICALISKEVTDRLLPESLARYERGDVVKFGEIEVSQKGIYRPGKLTLSWRGELTPWDELGEIKLKRGRFSAYHVQPVPTSAQDGQVSTIYTGKWQVWQKHGDFFGPHESYWPNLPVFVVMVSMILAQRGEAGVQEIEGFQQPLTFKEAATITRRKDMRRKRVTVISVIAAILLLISLPIAYFSYQGYVQQQRTDRDIQLLRNFFSAMAHKPYYAPVPGTNCDHGKAIWTEDDSNAYTCRQDGLLMTQKNFQYQDEIYFSFMPDDQWAYGHYIPQHYRVQVKAIIVSGGPDTCASLHVHIQDYQGRQEFDVCANGNWYYSRCDLYCNTDTQVASGELPQAKNSYLIAIDVTDSTLALMVDNKTIATIQDSTYSYTDEVALSLFGEGTPLVPVTALFSDFLYTPYK